MEALRPLNAYLSRNFYASANDTGVVAPTSSESDAIRSKSRSSSSSSGDSSGRSSSSSSVSFSGVVLSQEPSAHSKVLYNKDRLACNAAMLSSAGHPFWFVRVMHTDVYFFPSLRTRGRGGFLFLGEGCVAMTFVVGMRCCSLLLIIV